MEGDWTVAKTVPYSPVDAVRHSNRSQLIFMPLPSGAMSPRELVYPGEAAAVSPWPSISYRQVLHTYIGSHALRQLAVTYVFSITFGRE